MKTIGFLIAVGVAIGVTWLSIAATPEQLWEFGRIVLAILSGAMWLFIVAWLIARMEGP